MKNLRKEERLRRRALRREVEPVDFPYRLRHLSDMGISLKDALLTSALLCARGNSKLIISVEKPTARLDELADTGRLSQTVLTLPSVEA